MTGMIDLAVAHRRTVSTILNDPVIAASLPTTNRSAMSWTE